jgi:hypothetical protein
MAKQQSAGTQAHGDRRPFREVIEASERFALAEVSGGAMVEFVGRVQRWEQNRFVLLLPPQDDWGVLAVELDVGDVQAAEPIFEDSAGRKTYRVLVPSESLARLVFRAPDLAGRLAAQRDRTETPEPVAPWRYDLARQDPIQHAKPTRLAPVRAVPTGQRPPDPYAPVETRPQQPISYGQVATPQPYLPRTATPSHLQQDAGTYRQPVHGQRPGYGPAGYDPGLYQPVEPGHGGPAGYDPGLYRPVEPGYDPARYQPGEPGYGAPAGHDPAYYQPVEPGYGAPAGYDPAYYQPGEPGYGAPPGYDPARYQPVEPDSDAPAGYDPAYYQPSEGGYEPAGYDPAYYQHYQAGAYGHGAASPYDPYAGGEYDPNYPDPHYPYR